MKRTYILASGFTSLFLAAAVAAQSAPVAAPQQPVSYASITQLNGLLSPLEETSKSAQADLQKLRVDRWKTDGATKKQVMTNVDSIQRNLQGALPEIIGGLRSAPENVPATFKLYRNLDALLDVLSNVVEATEALGSKDDSQALSNDLSGFEGSRRQLAERITNLATSKEQEIVQLRTALKTAQAVAEPPKKIVVDDTEPAKKPAVTKKKAAPKSATTTSKPAAGQSTPAQNQTQNPPQTKPQ